jgi:hypothetical protein
MVFWIVIRRQAELLLVSLFGLLLGPEDGGSRFLQNVGLASKYTTIFFMVTAVKRSNPI